MLAEMTFGEFAVNFVTAAGLGGLIGLEREHRRDQTQIIAGVRTFPLFSLAGYLLTLVAIHVGEPMILAASILVFGAITVSFLWVRHTLGVTGLTTPMAMLVTFLLGVLIGYDYTQEAILVGIATTFLLLTKQRLHRFAEVLTDEEILSALQFITILFILFPITRTLDAPLLGQDWIGRGALVDPFRILLVVLFVSAISFASFLAMRIYGARRGVAVAGLFGGLVNSEATSVSLAEHAKDNPDLTRAATMGAILATTTMIARNAAIAAFTDPSLKVFGLFLAVTAPIAVAGLLFAYRHHEKAPAKLETPIRVKTPFAIAPAVRFAVLFAVLSVAAALAQQYAGDAGVYVTAIGGFVSAGAVTASVATLFVAGKIPLEVAAQTAVLATVIGVANKLVILRAVNEAVFERSRTAFSMMAAVGVASFLAFLAVGIALALVG